jgi:hypothetical protein
MAKKSLNGVIADKQSRGEDRIVVSMSFKFTDPFELGLLEHLWQFNHSQHLKRLLQRDKEGIVPILPSVALDLNEVDLEDDVSSFL